MILVWWRNEMNIKINDLQMCDFMRKGSFLISFEFIKIVEGSVTAG